MPDFLTAPCLQFECHCLVPKLPGRVCSGTTSGAVFGLCDDPPPEEYPAFLQEYRSEDWIAEVSNPELKEVRFKAVDNCVPVVRPDGNKERRSDGLLLYSNDIAFIELKHRGTQGWLADGIDQLTITIENFAQNHSLEAYENMKAYVCNGQHPLAVTGIGSELQRFKDETARILGNNGLNLIVDRNIKI
jgi:hypothetical protein